MLIWGLTYLTHNRSIKVISWLIKGTSVLLIGGSTLYVVIALLFSRKTYAFGLNLLGFSNVVGTLSFFWGLAAIFIFSSRGLFRRLHNKRVDNREIVRRILLLAKNHHNLFGWVTLIAATAHGVYFLFHPPTRWSEFNSGIGAWIALALLATSGMWMGHVAVAPSRARVARLSHLALTLGYVAAIILHVGAMVILAVVLFTAAFLAMGLIWTTMWLTHALKTR